MVFFIEQKSTILLKSNPPVFFFYHIVCILRAWIRKSFCSLVFSVSGLSTEACLCGFWRAVLPFFLTYDLEEAWQLVLMFGCPDGGKLWENWCALLSLRPVLPPTEMSPCDPVCTTRILSAQLLLIGKCHIPTQAEPSQSSCREFGVMTNLCWPLEGHANWRVWGWTSSYSRRS